MSQFIIEGGKPLSGEISVFGSKNAALPLLSAALLTADEVLISNIPSIRDVDSLCGIMSSIGVDVSRENDEVKIRAEEIAVSDLDEKMVGSLRGSVLLMGALLGRSRKAKLPMPGGDIIGARPVDVHLDAFRQMGADVKVSDSVVEIDGSALSAREVVLKELSVTATENVLLLAATLPGETVIRLAAAEPHVIALCEMLSLMGAKIEGAGTHTIKITGKETLSGTRFNNIPDMIEAGTFILLGVAANADIAVKNVPTQDLHIFFKLLEDMGARVSVDGSTVRVAPSEVRGFKLQTLPYPGLATDLQAPFSVVATQAKGSSLIHDPMYEGRFKYAGELMKMGARITVCDPHRIIIEGPTKLHGKHISSLDIRSGITLIMAGLIAEGETAIDDAEIVDRGYANLTERLSALGTNIRREQ